MSCLRVAEYSVQKQYSLWRLNNTFRNHRVPFFYAWVMVSLCSFGLTVSSFLTWKSLLEEYHRLHLLALNVFEVASQLDVWWENLVQSFDFVLHNINFVFDNIPFEFQMFRSFLKLKMYICFGRVYIQNKTFIV